MNKQIKKYEFTSLEDCTQKTSEYFKEQIDNKLQLLFGIIFVMSGRYIPLYVYVFSLILILYYSYVYVY